MRRIVKAAFLGLATISSTVSAHAQEPAANADTTPLPSSLKVMATAIPSSDLKRSLAFYTEGLGLISRGLVDMGEVTEAPLMLPGGGAYLILLKPAGTDTGANARGPLNRIILSVPDIRALAKRLSAAGYHLTAAIREMPKYGVAVAHVLDPDGNHIELVERTRREQ